jgi:hypothetical protein
MYIIRMNTSVSRGVSRGQNQQSPVSASQGFHPIEEDYNKKIKEAMKNENQK